MLYIEVSTFIYPISIAVSCFGIGCLYRAREEAETRPATHAHAHITLHAHVHAHVLYNMHMPHAHAHDMHMYMSHVHVHVASRLVSDRRSSPWANLFLFQTRFSFLVYPPLAI